MRKNEKRKKGVLGKNMMIMRKKRRGQLCGMLMGLTFSLVASIFFYKYFTMTTTLHITEETLSNPASPFLQSLSYSTITSVQCGGKWVRVYDLLSAVAAAGNSETVTACGTSIDLKAEVEHRLDNLATASSLCFEYGMKDAENNEMPIMKRLGEDCDAKFAKTGVKSRTHASYLFPLPPEKGLIARQVLTKVKPNEK